MKKFPQVSRAQLRTAVNQKLTELRRTNKNHHKGPPLSLRGFKREPPVSTKSLKADFKFGLGLPLG